MDDVKNTIICFKKEDSIDENWYH